MKISMTSIKKSAHKSQRHYKLTPQPTESYIIQVRASSTISRNCEELADIPRYCSGESNISQSVTCENDPPDAMQKDDPNSQQSHGGDDYTVTGLHGVICAEQEEEISETENIQSVNNADRETITWSYNADKYTKSKQNERGSGGNEEVTRVWVLRPDGVLTEVKSDITSSCVTGPEQINAGVKPFSCVTCGKSFGCSRSLRVHEKVYSGEILSCVMHVENRSLSYVV